MYVSSRGSGSQSLASISRFPQPLADSFSGSPQEVSGFPGHMRRRRVPCVHRSEFEQLDTSAKFFPIHRLDNDPCSNKGSMASPIGSISTPSSRRASPDYFANQGSRSTSTSPTNEGSIQAFFSKIAEHFDFSSFFSSDSSFDLAIKQAEEYYIRLEEEQKQQDAKDKKIK